MNPQDMDYNQSGFDNFMSRSVDNTPKLNLDSQSQPNNAVAFDRTQVTGPLGDTLRLGRIFLNGSTGNIVVNDGTNDFLIIGDDGS